MSSADAQVAEVHRLIVDEPPSASGGGQGPRGAGLNRLCRAAARALRASGAGVSLMTERGEQGVAASSDATSHILEELQFTLGEGPCQDAYAARAPVLVPDLFGEMAQVVAGPAASERWPGYAQAVHGRGVRAVFAFPLQVGARRLGVFDVYRDAPGSLSHQALAQALAFAEVAVTTLLDEQEGAGEEATEDAAGSFGDWLVVHQAQGMVMIQLGVDLAEAMARLRARAYSTDRRLSDVASDVVARRLVFWKDQDGA